MVLIFLENDTVLGDCLRIIATKGKLEEMWFDFGYSLGLTVGQLQEIGTTSTGTIQCTRRVILHWRGMNISESWEPLATALAKIGFQDLAHKLQENFNTRPESDASLSYYQGVYCSLCDKYHLNFDDFQQHVPSK